MLAEKADLGLAFDGDGDRLIMVDGEGKVRDGDNVMYIIAKDRNAQNKLHGGVVGTLMTNLGMEQALQREHIDFARSAVGDRYVMEMLLQKGWHLGGENSGHVICLDYVTTGDAIVSALQVLKACIRQGKSIAELSEDLIMYPQDLINVRMSSAFDALNDAKVLAEVKAVESELGTRGRVLLRKSGTEPVVRVMVEGEEMDTVHNYAQRIANVIVHQSEGENA